MTSYPGPVVVSRRSQRTSASHGTLTITQAEAFADKNVVEMRPVFREIGTHCAQLDKTASSLAVLIRDLRAKGIRLADRASWTCANAYMRETHNPQTSKNEKTLQIYTNRLRDYLHMPPNLVPENICISSPVKDWTMAGHEIDVQFEAGWWHAVVLDVTKFKLKVFWVGYPALLPFGTRSSNPDVVINPASLDKKGSIYRPHEEGAASGASRTFGVAWILKNYLTIPEKFEDIIRVDVSDDADSPDTEGQGDGAKTKKQKLDDASRATDHATASASASQTKDPEPNPNSNKKKVGKSKANPNPTPKSSLKKKKKKKNAEKKPEAGGAPSGNEKNCHPTHHPSRPSPSTFEWLRPFLGCDVIMHSLILLEQTPTLQTDVSIFLHHVKLLEELRRGQGCFYAAPGKFKDYFQKQKSALEAYPCTEVKFSSEKKAMFVQQINTEFRATYTNMFTKNELAVISCLLAYPGLSFCNIDQKRSSTQSDGMTRGMAFVPDQLESFFHRRLRLLGLVDPVAHPPYMEPLSTVVLNSTYCYQQQMMWSFGDNWFSLSERAFKLSGFPEFLSVNGLYVCVDHDFNVSDADFSQCHLYAQVKSQKTRDSLGLDPKFCDTFGDDWARVIVVDKSDPQFWKANVHVWISIGPFQAEDPICVARFNMNQPKTGTSAAETKWLSAAHEVGEPVMFSHLDSNGAPLYQPIQAIKGKGDTAKGTLPKFTFGPVTLAYQPLEYGPTPESFAVPPKTNNRYDKPLKAQAPHCDGNFFHSKGQWVRDAPAEPFRLSSHNPFKTRGSMEDEATMEALILDGPLHLNSLSFLMGINFNTTLTFPGRTRDRTGTGTVVLRESDAEEDTPFGGCAAISFVEKHMGSAYDDPNERPHLYAHCADLRQFPVSTAGCLIAVLAAKERIECLRKDGRRVERPVPTFLKNEMTNLENALGQFILQHLVTSTYKSGVQEKMLDRVRCAAVAGPIPKKAAPGAD